MLLRRKIILCFVATPTFLYLANVFAYFAPKSSLIESSSVHECYGYQYQAESTTEASLIDSFKHVFHGSAKKGTKKLERCRPPNKNDEIFRRTEDGVVQINKHENVSYEDLIHAHTDIELGGHWRPTTCRPRSRVAIIIAFRDRAHHLFTLLKYLLPQLKWQRLDFTVYVSEQQGSDLFNKGRLYNSAFFVAERDGIDCVIFHDVDLVPQLLTASYDCPDWPTHQAQYVDSLHYRKAYEYLAGGVFKIRVEQFRKINGYSNMFWTWGGEDDDIGLRVLNRQMKLLRPSIFESRYRMLPHAKRKATNAKLVRKLLKQSSERMLFDGLSSGCDEWRILSVQKQPLFTRLLVDVGVPPAEWRIVNTEEERNFTGEYATSSP